MPLEKSKSKKAIGRNIATESKTHPRKQAVAIALNVARQAGADIPKPRTEMGKKIKNQIDKKKHKSAMYA